MKCKNIYQMNLLFELLDIVFIKSRSQRPSNNFEHSWSSNDTWQSYQNIKLRYHRQLSNKVFCFCVCGEVCHSFFKPYLGCELTSIVFTSYNLIHSYSSWNSLSIFIILHLFVAFGSPTVHLLNIFHFGLMSMYIFLFCDFRSFLAASWT